MAVARCGNGTGRRLRGAGRAVLLVVLLWVFPGAALSATAEDRTSDGTSRRFTTRPPGADLPGGRECAVRIRRSRAEIRPDNQAANLTPGGQVVSITGARRLNAPFSARIDGTFSGSTDEIIQWAACKWGLDEDLARAVAVQESWWRQSARGRHSFRGTRSYGLFQVNPEAHPGTWPGSERSTAFNADYALGWWRACFEGDIGWLVGGPTPYRAGDALGCFGAWNSGAWRDAQALRYIGSIEMHLRERTWELERFRDRPAFSRPPWPW